MRKQLESAHPGMGSGSRSANPRGLKGATYGPVPTPTEKAMQDNRRSERVAALLDKHKLGQLMRPR